MRKLIKVSKDFSSTPGPRYIKEGDYSGELFRTKLLAQAVIDAIENEDEISVDLDGTAGFGTSFLEESFGGLIRENKLDYHKIIKYLKLISTEEEFLIDDIQKYLSDAYNEKK
ncbi:STAS-like domain-containing protein [Treponema denticola]|uniref:STAS-like domain-containing protein n=1 Tax=Treponema denticola TaxID=158 RepID=UPI0020A29E26|nr:STAS-like domain-containing protein [Treponema denticola]UTC97552.1 STAS-like domain-containing protein [Treponema denticola]